MLIYNVILTQRMEDAIIKFGSCMRLNLHVYQTKTLLQGKRKLMVSELVSQTLIS